MNHSDASRAIAERYLSSADFNGFPLRDLASTDRERRQLAAALVENGQASVNFGDRHPNPHILAFEPEPPEEQLRKLESGADLKHACLYPSSEYLATIVDSKDYVGRPNGSPESPEGDETRLRERSLPRCTLDPRRARPYRTEP